MTSTVFFPQYLKLATPEVATTVQTCHVLELPKSLNMKATFARPSNFNPNPTQYVIYGQAPSKPETMLVKLATMVYALVINNITFYSSNVIIYMFTPTNYIKAICCFPFSFIIFADETAKSHRIQVYKSSPEIE